MNMNLSFKEYKVPQYIEQQWYQSPKRCFDLSMAPNEMFMKLGTNKEDQ